MNNEYRDEEITGIDTDGGLIQWNASTKRNENCGESLESYGVNNLSEKELTRLMYCKGMIVLSKDGKKKGKLTGGSRHCGMEGCTGKALAVRWEDGKLTYPCTKGMDFGSLGWQIG